MEPHIKRAKRAGILEEDRFDEVLQEYEATGVLPECLGQIIDEGDEEDSDEDDENSFDDYEDEDSNGEDYGDDDDGHDYQPEPTQATVPDEVMQVSPEVNRIAGEEDLPQDVIARLILPPGTTIGDAEIIRGVQVARKRSRLAALGPLSTDFSCKLQKLCPRNTVVSERDLLEAGSSTVDEQEPQTVETMSVEELLYLHRDRLEGEEVRRRLVEASRNNPQLHVTTSDSRAVNQVQEWQLHLQIPDEELTDEQRAIKRFFLGNPNVHVEYHSDLDDDD